MGFSVYAYLEDQWSHGNCGWLRAMPSQYLPQSECKVTDKSLEVHNPELSSVKSLLSFEQLLENQKLRLKQTCLPCINRCGINSIPNRSLEISLLDSSRSTSMFHAIPINGNPSTLLVVNHRVSPIPLHPATLPLILFPVKYVEGTTTTHWIAFTE